MRIPPFVIRKLRAFFEFHGAFVFFKVSNREQILKIICIFSFLTFFLQNHWSQGHQKIIVFSHQYYLQILLYYIFSYPFLACHRTVRVVVVVVGGGTTLRS